MNAHLKEPGMTQHLTAEAIRYKVSDLNRLLEMAARQGLNVTINTENKTLDDVNIMEIVGRGHTVPAERSHEVYTHIDCTIFKVEVFK